MHIEGWRMKLQRYLVKVKNQAFDKEKCYIWVEPGSKGTYELDYPWMCFVEGVEDSSDWIDQMTVHETLKCEKNIQHVGL